MVKKYKPNEKEKYMCAKHLAFFKKKLTLPVTERVFNQIITLPLHPDLNLKDIDYISKTLKDVLKEI